jgi:hypothetical protein
MQVPALITNKKLTCSDRATHARGGAAILMRRAYAVAAIGLISTV